LPLLIQYVKGDDQGKFHLLPRLRCIGDFLDDGRLSATSSAT
jgi:hypothetical protein